MKTKLAITESTLSDAIAPLLLDKMIKKTRFLLGNTRELCIALPEERYALRSMATLHGIPVEITPTPSHDDPLTFFLDNEPQTIRLPEGIVDWHAHTQFAYCGRGIDFADAATLAFRIGIHRQCFAEHGFALYFPANALKFHWLSDPAFVDNIWCTPHRGRMTMYRAMVEQARSLYGDRVRFGMETDLFGGGRLCLAPEDEGFFDYLIGAIHEIEDINPKTTTDAELEYAWQRDVERLLSYPIQILAHPFRYFPWYNRKIPTHLYRPVARMLAERQIVAEINHHANPFENRFFEICLEEGVTISLGTDAHITRNAADLLPHLKTLQEIQLPISALYA